MVWTRRRACGEAAITLAGLICPKMSKEWRPFPYPPFLHWRVAFFNPNEHIVFGYIFDFWATRERIAIEAVTEVCGQTVLVG